MLLRKTVFTSWCQDKRKIIAIIRNMIDRYFSREGQKGYADGIIIIPKDGYSVTGVRYIIERKIMPQFFILFCE